jgi:hypothetical protein
MDKMNTDIEIIGSGNIGDKARQLLEKTPKLREIGFHTPQRYFFAQDYFEGFFQKNKLGTNLNDVEITEDLESRIKHGSLTQNEFLELERAINSIEGDLIAIRSSAAGDARGTGIYKTEFLVKNTSNVVKSLKKVLASYYSPDAIAFRKDANTGEGFGIIIEPLIGQNIDSQTFAPVFSGFSYTSTSRGEGYISVVPGIGGGVNSRDCEKINRRGAERFGNKLLDYMIKRKKDAFDYDRMPGRKSALVKPRGMAFDDNFFVGEAYCKPTKYGRGGFLNAGFDFNENVRNLIFDLDLNTILDLMERTEKVFGKPQYFEWAMTIEDSKPKYWITQIADVDKKLDIMNFGDFGEIIFACHTVTGSGIKECHKIVDCWNPENVEPLYKVNQTNKDYILLFSSRLTTSMLSSDVRGLSYSDYNNASVFIEIQDSLHLDGNPTSHLDGRLRDTGKFFGVLDYDSDIPPKFDLFRSKSVDESGIRVYQGRFKVVSSERQNKLVVYALD